jgi:hypothetical protein
MAYCKDKTIIHRMPQLKNYSIHCRKSIIIISYSLLTIFFPRPINLMCGIIRITVPKNTCLLTQNLIIYTYYEDYFFVTCTALEEFQKVFFCILSVNMNKMSRSLKQLKFMGVDKHSPTSLPLFFSVFCAAY